MAKTKSESENKRSKGYLKIENENQKGKAITTNNPESESEEVIIPSSSTESENDVVSESEEEKPMKIEKNYPNISKSNSKMMNEAKNKKPEPENFVVATSSTESENNVVSENEDTEEEKGEEEDEKEEEKPKKSNNRNNSPKDRKKKKKKIEEDEEEEKSAKLYQFPMTQMNRIIKSVDPDSRISQEAVFLINKATEKFLELFAKEAYSCAFLDRKSSVAYNHLSSVVTKRKRFDFLSDYVPEKVKAEDALAEMSMNET